MPDLERLTDKLALDMATTPARRAFIEGWIAGKRLARKQIAIAAAFAAVLVAVVFVCVGV